MWIKEYQEFTATTAIYPKDRALEYLVPALCSETLELVEVLTDLEYAESRENESNVLKESGDIIWDISELCTLFKIDLSEMCLEAQKRMRKDNFIRVNDLTSSTEAILGRYSKSIRDSWGEDKTKGRLIDCSIDILTITIETLLQYGYTLKDAINANIEKLSSRKERDVIKGSGDNR